MDRKRVSGVQWGSVGIIWQRLAKLVFFHKCDGCHYQRDNDLKHHHTLRLHDPCSRHDHKRRASQRQRRLLDKLRNHKPRTNIGRKHGRLRNAINNGFDNHQYRLATPIIHMERHNKINLHLRQLGRLRDFRFGLHRIYRFQGYGLSLRFRLSWQWCFPCRDKRNHVHRGSVRIRPVLRV